MASKSARRICFATTHRNALKRESGGRWIGKFSVPFGDSVRPIFEEATGIRLKESRYGGVWKSLTRESEYAAIESWVEDQGSRIFLRDLMSLSIALDVNFEEDNRHTVIGELEYRAKYKDDIEAARELCNITASTIKKIPFYRDCSTICAIPSNPGKPFDLPSYIVKHVSSMLQIENITEYFSWRTTKPSLKGVAVGDKWDVLESVGLNCSDSIDGNVILVDDLYQSGATMQFVANALITNGANRVFGLAVVKSWGNTDNQ